MSEAKRKIKDATTVEVSGEEKLVMFGWCLTGHHDGCSVEFPRHRCACECHKEGKNE